MSVLFNEQDLDDIKEHGIPLDEVLRQIDIFARGFKPAKLVRPCTVGDGIIRLTEKQVEEFIRTFDENSESLALVKFVPASGAATRMFRDLHALRLAYLEQRELGADLKKIEETFFNSIDRFPFVDMLDRSLRKKGTSLAECLKTKAYFKILDHLLTENGLNLANLPKGLIPFHRYSEGVRTPVEEHMIEAMVYARGKGGISRLYFTVRPEHRTLFVQHVQQALSNEPFRDHPFNIDFSIQDPSTDTIAVDMENRPFRDNEGRIIFRPGGHGALLRNLNQIHADIIFIKNIDNVAIDAWKKPTYRYMKALAGYLIEIRTKMQEIWMKVKQKGSKREMADALEWLSLNLDDVLPKNWKHLDDESLRSALTDYLDRPIRVCGMVPNAGQPGGGPFWVMGRDGMVTKQIVESAQVDMNDEVQRSIWESATHFNPVFIVAITKNYEGQRYDLTRFVDPEAYFITEKSFEGRPLRALEHPGLWNGSMADWLTVFVEVPPATFNPVKTVFDLLKEPHQPVN